MKSTIIIFIAIILAVISSTAFSSDSISQPNILFFLVDDQRYDTLGVAGHPIIETPEIDQLAKEGIWFKESFVTTPICAASRASFLTGLHERTHRYTFGTSPISKEHTLNSYPYILKQAGYYTGLIGKYGVETEGDLENRMFNKFTPISRYPYFIKQPGGALRHGTEVVGDQVIKFLNNIPKDTPFCLSVSFNAVHAAASSEVPDPFPWPKAVDGMYENVEIPVPVPSATTNFEIQPEFLKKSLNRIRYFWRWDTPEKYQRNMKAYYRMISGVDRVIGRIRKELDKLHLANNTVIIYMSDNGYYMGSRGFAGKWSHYEESIRVPLIIADPYLPKEKRGVVNNAISLNIDIAPTILEYAGVDIPAHYQGSSLKPVIYGKKPLNWRRSFFAEHLMDHEDIPKWGGVRGKRFVYARYFEQQPGYEFLHNIKADPYQHVNLADNPLYKPIVMYMRYRTNKFKKRYENFLIN